MTYPPGDIENDDTPDDDAGVPATPASPEALDPGTTGVEAVEFHRDSDEAAVAGSGEPIPVSEPGFEGDAAAGPSDGVVPQEPAADTGGGEAIGPEAGESGVAATAEEPVKRAWPFWIEVPVLVLVALVVAVVIKTFLIQAFYIPSGSMEDTLQINDRILVNKLAFRWDDPHRGDVVVFDSGERRDESILEGIRRNVAEAVGLSAPESDFIKRVIGLPGEVLEIRHNTVYIDGTPLVEPYLKAGTRMADFGPVTVEPDHYFMMGDNRNLSSDSRFNGTVSRDRLVGRAFVIIWPPGNWSGL